MGFAHTGMKLEIFTAVTSMDLPAMDNSIVSTENVLMDIVVPPGMDVVKVLREIIGWREHIVVLDMVGNLYSKVTHGPRNELESLAGEIECHFVSSAEKLLSMVEKQRNKRGFTLVIDSLVHFQDAFVFGIRDLSGLLWSIVYDCGSTVVTINNYKVEFGLDSPRLVPRMGKLWPELVSYQLLVEKNPEKISYTVQRNPLLVDFLGCAADTVESPRDTSDYLSSLD